MTVERRREGGTLSRDGDEERLESASTRERRKSESQLILLALEENQVSQMLRVDSSMSMASCPSPYTTTTSW